MRRFFKFIYIIFIIAIFFAIAIYLPKMDAGILESQYVNQYTLVKQDNQEQGIRYDLPLVDKLSAFFSTEYSKELLSIHSIGELKSQDEALLEGLQSQISILEKADIIPELVETERLENSFDEALYYNISNVENPNVVVPVWKMRFYESGVFRYQFVIDARTYKIYSASICGYSFYDFWLEKGLFITDVGKIGRENLMDIEGKIEDQLSDYYESDYFLIDSYSVYKEPVLQGGLYYNTDSPDAIIIPFNIYYYHEYEEDMEGMFIGIVSDWGDTTIEYDTGTNSSGLMQK